MKSDLNNAMNGVSVDGVVTKTELHFPLSFPQQRMWFFNQLLPNSPLYNVSNVFELNGPLDIQALQKSLMELVLRHEALRTTFRVIEQQPMQVISPLPELFLLVHDFSELASSQKQIEVSKFINQECRWIFSLEKGPLFRAFLLRLSNKHHVFVLNFHHIICDGWSLQNLFQELGFLYNAYLLGQPSPLPKLEFQYSDFSNWQRSLNGDSFAKQLDYWKRQLADCTSILKLPYDQPKPILNNYQGNHLSVDLPDSLSDSIIAFSRKHKTTPFITLLAALNVLLFRYTGQEDILIGSTIANRKRIEHEPLIGIFINTLILRGNLSGDPNFLDLLGRIRETAMSAYSNQDIPFEKLIEELQPQRLPGQTPLFQVLFDFQKDYGEALHFPNITSRNLPTPDNGTAKFDLMISFLQNKNHIGGAIQYNSEIFYEQTVLRMFSHFKTLLESILSNPDGRISTLPLLTREERHQLTVAWNETSCEYPAQRSIHDLFEAQAAQRPDALAVVFGNSTLTYGQLNARANQLARYFNSIGVTKNSLIGVCLERSVEMIVTLLAVLKAGAAYLPLEASYPQDRLTFMMSDSCMRFVVTSKSLALKIQPNGVSTTVLEDLWPSLESLSDENLSCQLTAETLAYVMYTSGSTGNPKGVCVSHRAVNRLVCNTNYVTFSPSDRVAQISNSSFDALTFELWGALSHGACLVGITKDVALSPSRLVETIRNERITTMFLTAALFNFVIRELPDGFQTLEQLIVGGEALEPRWIRECIRNGPPIKLTNGYGPTEATTFSTTFQIREVAEEATNIPIGRPISNTRVYILDPNMEPLPIGVPGEIYIGGDGLANGYLNRPELTAQRFVRDPFITDPKACLYKTGDIARYLPDGNIEFIGRLDHQIKIRGFRIELEEIEAILTLNPSIEKALVLCNADSRADKKLIAYITTRSQFGPSADELRDFLKAKLPDYMIPSRFVFVDTLPLGPGGKVNRQLAPFMLSKKDSMENPRIDPRGPIEEAIANVWCEVLHLNEIGIDENFFDVGGHSLLATQVISRIRKLLKIDLPLMTIFEAPTIRRFREKIPFSVDSRKNSRTAAIIKISRDQELPLSFPQQRLWFLDQLSPNNAFYNVCFPISVKGTLNIDALRTSLNEIIRRHEILRTTFSSREGRPVQIVHPNPELKLPVTDLSHLTASDKGAQFSLLINEEARKPFDLTNGPLFRAGLIRLDKDEHILILNWHHIIFDGWSLGLFGRELTILYQTFLTGRTSPLPELPFQYADFANWQRQHIQGDFLEKQLSYWRKQLDKIPPVLDLPFDRPRPMIESFRGSTYQFIFPVDLQSSLMEFSLRESGTLFMVLLTAFMTLLHRYTGQNDIVVGSPVANRSRNEIENLIGFFVNTLVLRGNISGSSTFLETFEQMREVCLQAFAHQDLPFEKLVELLQPERNLSHSPLFQVMFVLQNAPAQSIRLSDASLTQIPVERGTAGFDLKLSMVKSDQGLKGSFEYNTDLFDEQTIIRMTSHFQTLLQGIATDPEQRISKLPLLSDAERNQIEIEWNNTNTPYPLDRCIDDVFEEQAAHTPDSLAIVCGDRKINYRELNRRSNIIAHSLMKSGCKADTIVGLCVERSIEMVIGLLGILKAGGAFLPVDPSLPEERLKFLLEDSQTQFLLTQKSLNERIAHCQSRTKLFLDSDWEKNSTDCRNPNMVLNPENLAYLMYTSGSTGLPKAVLGTHRASLNRFQWMWDAYRFESDEVCCQKTSLNFIDSIWEIFGPLLRGIPLVIVSDHAVHDPTLFTKILAENSVTRIVLVPSLLAALLNSGISAKELPTLKICISSGESLSPELCLKFHNAFPGKLLVNLYGSTEVAGDVTCYETVPTDSNRMRIPVGRPIANNQVYILDQSLNSTPIGVPGELHVAGAGLSKGYWNRESINSQKFISNPFSSQSGSLMYKTGDLARYLPDGTVDLLGRIDQQIKIRGYRVEPAEVEKSLNLHPQVRQCVISTFQDQTKDKSLIAYVVPSEMPGPLPAELRSFLKHKLPDFMIPSLFMNVESLPLTATGKIDQKSLPTPERSANAVKTNRMPTSVEKQLLEIWKMILPVKAIQITDNFFDLGGHSLLAVRLMAAIEERFGTKLPLAILFQAPTIQNLASLIEQQDHSALNKSLIPIQPSGSRFPFFCAPGLGGSVIGLGRLAPHLGNDQPLYGLELTTDLNGQLRHETIEQMSAHFLSEIRKLQPKGPYFLGGFSFGGLIVFEIAQQLKSLGENVALLALFDTNAKNTISNGRKKTMWSRIGFQTKIMWTLTWAGKVDYLLARVDQAFSGNHKTTKKAAAMTSGNSDRARVKEVSIHAALQYRPHPYRGRVTLFRGIHDWHSDPQLNWGPLAEGGLETYRVPVLHSILGRDSFVRVIAPLLRDCLNRAQPNP